jgi:hypothetical protein
MIIRTVTFISLLFSSLLYTGSAFAMNHCGYWKSGKVVNLMHTIPVTGYTKSNRRVTRKLKYGMEARHIGICDAEYFRWKWHWFRVPQAHKVVVRPYIWYAVPDTSTP